MPEGIQKKLAAEHVLSGDKPAICITEPEAGSAATEMTTRADHVGNRYILNGTKNWITGGGVSKFHLIFARVFEDCISQGITGFIALKGAKGLKIGKREPAMGLRGIPETQIIFDDLEILEEMLRDILLPVLMKEIHRDLVRESKEAIMKQGAETYRKLVTVGPFRQKATKFVNVLQGKKVTTNILSMSNSSCFHF